MNPDDILYSPIPPKPEGEAPATPLPGTLWVTYGVDADPEWIDDPRAALKRLLHQSPGAHTDAEIIDTYIQKLEEARIRAIYTEWEGRVE